MKKSCRGRPISAVSNNSQNTWELKEKTGKNKESV